MTDELTIWIAGQCGEKKIVGTGIQNMKYQGNIRGL
jgi:hypothetical protein